MRIRIALLGALSSASVFARSVPGADAAAISGYTLPIGSGARNIKSLDSETKRSDAPKNALAARGMPHFVESGAGPGQLSEGDIPPELTGSLQPIQPTDANENVSTVFVTSVRTLTETPPAPPSSTSQSSQISSNSVSAASQAPLTTDSTTSPVYLTKTVTITESGRRHAEETTSQSSSLATSTGTVTHAPAPFPHSSSSNWPQDNTTTTTLASGSTSATVYGPVSTSSCSSPGPVKTECGCETTIQTACPSTSTTTSSKSDVAVVTMSGPLGVSPVTITYSTANSWSTTSSTTVHSNTTAPSWTASSWTRTSSSTAAHNVTVTVQTQTPVPIPQSNRGSRLSPHPIFLLPRSLLKTLIPLSYLVPATNAESSIRHIRTEVDRRNTTQILGNLNNINISVTRDVTCTSSLDNGTFTVECQKSGASRSVAIPGVLAFPVHFFGTVMARLQPAKVKRTCYGDLEGAEGISCSAGSRSPPIVSQSNYSTLFFYASAWLFCAVAGAVAVAWLQEGTGVELFERTEREDVGGGMMED